MKQFEMIKKGDCGKIQEKFKCIEKLTIAMYSKFECNQLQPQTKKITPFVEINHNGKAFYFCKMTVVWLFQESDWVSTDRLFRVRSTQPYSADCVVAMKSTVCKSSEVSSRL